MEERNTVSQDNISRPNAVSYGISLQINFLGLRKMNVNILAKVCPHLWLCIMYHLCPFKAERNATVCHMDWMLPLCVNGISKKILSSSFQETFHVLLQGENPTWSTFTPFSLTPSPFLPTSPFAPSAFIDVSPKLVRTQVWEGRFHARKWDAM